MPMHEVLRQEYLENMGIQSYIPRFQLAGARESSLCEVPALPAELLQREPDATEDFPEKTQAAAAQQRAAEKPLARPAASPEVHPKADLKESYRPQVAAKPAAGPAARLATPEQLRFRLAFIRAGSGLSALVQLPHAERTQGLSQASIRLFANMCRALGQDPGAVSVDPLLFQWPFSEALHHDRSPAAAAKALQAYIAEKLQQDKQEKQILLLMGTQLGELLPADATRMLVQTRSLQEMLSMPLFKREAWQALRSLRA